MSEIQRTWGFYPMYLPQAGVVANWDKSSRSWNNSHMTRIKTAMQDAGHRVEGDGAISAAALRGQGSSWRPERGDHLG